MRILATVHLYYVDMWKDISEYLINLGNYDLIVTISNSNKDVIDAIYSFKPNAKVYVTENVGYDIYPFLETLKKVDLSSYDFLVKLHTKKNRGKEITYLSNRYRISGAFWQKSLYSFVSSKKTFLRCLKSFIKDNNLGMSNAFCLIDKLKQNEKDQHKQYCFTKARELLTSVGLSSNLNEPAYIAGTMFICRAFLLEPLKKLDFNKSDFESNSLGNDLPHSLERFLGLIICGQGYLIKDKYSSVWFKLTYLLNDINCRLIEYKKKFELFNDIRLLKKVSRFIYRKEIVGDKTIIKIFKIRIK